MMEFSTGLTPLEIESQFDDTSAGTSLVGFLQGRLPRRPHAARPAEIATESLPSAIASNWTKLQASGLSRKFYSRLLRLASDRFNAGPRSTERLRASSLSDFLDLWSKIKDQAIEPELSLSSDGSLTAEWFKSPEERLDIKFARSAILFGLFNNGHILEGAENKDLVAMILLGHRAKPLQWRAKD